MEENEIESPISVISDEILLYIFHFLDVKSLCELAHVSHSWNQLAHDAHLWRKIISTKKTEDQLYTDQILAVDSYDWKRLYFKLSKLNHQSAKYSLIKDPVQASSVDHKDQGLDKTLIPLDLRSQDVFWSSTGSHDPTSSEWAIFKLRQPICAIFSVSILPYRASFQQGLPTYGPQTIQISVGFSPKSWHWTSEVMPVDNKHVFQTFPIAPYMAVGGYLKIEFQGRCAIQPQDSLYYTFVLEYITAAGLPLGCFQDPLIRTSLINFACTQSTFVNEIKDSVKDEDVQKSLDNLPKSTEELTSQLSLIMTNEMASFIGSEAQREQGISQIFKFLQSKQVPDAVRLVLANRDLRSRETFSLFAQEGPFVLQQYFNILIRNNLVFTRYESYEVAKLVLDESRAELLIGTWIDENRLTLSEELGDMVREKGMTALAGIIYMSIPVPDKAIEVLIELKNYKKVVKYIQYFQLKMDYLKIIQDIMKGSMKDALAFAVALAEHKGGSPVDLEQVCDVLGIVRKHDEWDLAKLLKSKFENYNKESEENG